MMEVTFALIVLPVFLILMFILVWDRVSMAFEQVVTWIRDLF